MRRLLLRSAAVITCLITVLIAWIIGARPLSMLLDRVHTMQIDSQPILRLGIDDAGGGTLRINDLPMSTTMPNHRPCPIEMTVDGSRQFVVRSAGHLMMLGRLDDSLGAIKPQPGDITRFNIDRSLLSWPTPLDLNFMTGHSPSWKRHLYYHLVWEKPNGSRLEMVWRYEQYYYDRWASGFMTREGTTGLIRVDIRL